MIFFFSPNSCYRLYRGVYNTYSNFVRMRVCMRVVVFMRMRVIMFMRRVLRVFMRMFMGMRLCMLVVVHVRLLRL